MGNFKIHLNNFNTPYRAPAFKKFLSQSEVFSPLSPHHRKNLKRKREGFVYLEYYYILIRLVNTHITSLQSEAYETPSDQEGSVFG